MDENFLFERISRRYNRYIAKFGQHGKVWRGNEAGIVISDDPMNSSDDVGEIEFPMEATLREDNGSFYIQKIDSWWERTCLFSYDNQIPPIETFPLEVLGKLPILLLDIFRIQVSEDGLNYWTFTHETLKYYINDEEIVSNETWRAIDLLFNAGLVTLDYSPRIRSIDKRVKSFARESQSLAAYLAFPTLEGLAKELSRRNIDIDGKVKRANTVKNYGRGPEYHAVGYPVSSLEDVLFHLEEETSSDRLGENMKRFREKMVDINISEPGSEYKMLYNWRNETMHGGSYPVVKFGIILHLICMILWDLIHQHHEEQLLERD